MWLTSPLARTLQIRERRCQPAVCVKKPHKHKSAKSAAPRGRRAQEEAASLVSHTTRRPPAPARLDPRRAQANRRHEQASLYRRSGPLRVESRDDRKTIRLLLLPFAIMAFALAILPSLHVFPTLQDLIARTPVQSLRVFTAVAELPSLQARELRDDAAIAIPTAQQPDNPVLATATPKPDVPSLVSQAPSASLASMPVVSARPSLAIAALKTTTVLAPLAWAEGGRALVAATAPTFSAFALPEIANLTRVTSPLAAARQVEMAMITIKPARSERYQVAALVPELLSLVPPTPYEMSCPVTYATASTAENDGNAATASASFGSRLAAAAASQTRRFVIYDDKYRQIARAGGDVPALYGVCTDVVVRAYRALGIDLQTLVQASRLGAGDPNIDHRRTETLRRYLARYGQSLPITSFGENFQPGDIVTYWRPQNSGSRSHIAIIASAIGPSGNPMIIHNRGWGPQLEDGLFVDRITGHYRYDGATRPPLPPQLAASKAAPFPVSAAATRAALPVGNEARFAKPNGL